MGLLGRRLLGSAGLSWRVLGSRPDAASGCAEVRRSPAATAMSGSETRAQGVCQETSEDGSAREEEDAAAV